MKLAGFEITRARPALPAAPEAPKKRAWEEGGGTGWFKNIIELLNGGKTASGVSVSEVGALGVGAVFTAVRIISSTIASLPLHTYRRTDDGARELAMSHWAYTLLHDSPNRFHTSYLWRELILAHVMLWGNSYNRIEWLRNGSAGELLPLMPWQVQPQLNKSGTEKRYVVRLRDGREELPDDEVIHIPGLSYDGLQGVSVVRTQRDALGTSKAMELFTGAFFRNGAKPGAIMEVPGRMNPDAQKNLAASVIEKFGSAEDAFKVLVLEEGSKLHTYTMPLEDAQLLELKKYSRAEIFGWYGVPPHLAGDTERQTSWGTGIEQMDIGYAKHTITPWLTRIEQELNRKLFPRRSGLFVKFNLDALLRGDFKTRMEGLLTAVGGPFLRASEARELEDWPAVEGADKLLRPLNMGVVGDEPPPAPTNGGTPPAPPSDGGDGQDDGEDDDMRRSRVEVHIAAPPPMPAPVVNVSAPVSIGKEFEMRSPDFEQGLTRQQEVFTALFGELGRQMRETVAGCLRELQVDRATADAATREFTERMTGELRAGLQSVAQEISRPRKAVLDDDGNPIGSVPVDSL